MLAERARPAAFALLSLAACWLLFYEYLPPLRRVHLFADIEGYHYPLLSYSFLALKQGRLPEWDPTIYCGLPFAGNVQAALFYPPNWLLFLSNWHRPGLSFLRLEIMVMVHFWAALLLAYGWFRERRLGRMAAVLGAGTYAFSGYMLGDIQHTGVACAYTWFPLGLWGVDEAARRNSVWPLWKLIAASTLCFLAGYPSAWVVFCGSVFTLALTHAARMWLAPAVLGALAASLAAGAVQLLPALDAAALKTPETVYGASIPSGTFWLSLVFPNFFDQGRLVPVGPPDEQYLFVGLPALFAFVWAARAWRRLAAPALLAAVALAVMYNPLGLGKRLVALHPLFGEVVREWNFLAMIAVASALAAAISLDHFLSAPARPMPRWAAPAAAAALAVLSARLWWISLPGGAGFPSGWGSAAETIPQLCVFAFALWTWRARPRPALVALLLFTALTAAKVYGTNRRFNAVDGDVDRMFRTDARQGGPEFLGLPPHVFAIMRSHPDYRVSMAEGPHGTDLRHYQLTTPQGFDPFLPRQYLDEVGALTDFQTNRLFNLDPTNEVLLQHFAVRYIVTREGSPYDRALAAHTQFRRLHPEGSFYAAYEYLRALPAWRFPGEAVRLRWTPERREFAVRSAGGGDFLLIEQFYPGWRAYVDGKPTPIARYSKAFQRAAVPPGEHRVLFEYRARGLRAGAALSLVSLAALAWMARRARRLAHNPE